MLCGINAEHDQITIIARKWNEREEGLSKETYQFVLEKIQNN